MSTATECLGVTPHRAGLQGEHGTGRNMAPFVEMEWGARATGIMARIKDAFDPQHLLNPGVILNQVLCRHDGVATMGCVLAMRWLSQHDWGN